MRILIVDDEPLELDQLEWMIHSFDPSWQVRRAVDGNEALSSLKKVFFDLILLDINMPGLNGLEVAERLRVDYPNLPVVMVTAQTDFTHTRRALQLGVADYLSKPVIERELLSVPGVADVNSFGGEEKIYEIKTHFYPFTFYFLLWFCSNFRTKTRRTYPKNHHHF